MVVAWKLDYSYVNSSNTMSTFQCPCVYGHKPDTGSDIFLNNNLLVTKMSQTLS